MECDVLLLAPDGIGDSDGGKATLHRAVQARSRSFVLLSCSSSFVVTEAASQVRRHETAQCCLLGVRLMTVLLWQSTIICCTWRWPAQ